MTALTGPQLAERMGVSRITVYNRIKKGHIPARKVGRNYVISARVVGRLLGERLTSAQERWLHHAVKTVVAEYGPLLKCLSKE